MEIFIYMMEAGKEAAKSINFFCALGPFDQILEMGAASYLQSIAHMTASSFLSTYQVWNEDLLLT